MRKCLLLLMVLALLLPGGHAFAEEAALAQVGESLHGFTVTDTGAEGLTQTPTITLIHKKTGSQVLYMAADDPECSFMIAFKTPALNDKGIPHVFEHVCISGSEKYPSSNLFFPVTSQTYNTFVNALTDRHVTMYPLSSMSQEQLLTLADYYLDGVFNPMIYTEERLFKREAWRYALETPDAPLTLTGTVLSEMRGNDNIYSAAEYALLDALYPGSILSNNAGGNPEHIPEMTWQELLDFHETYYHPSNALTVLYGRLDLAQFLQKLDAYFSAFEAATIPVETGKTPPQEQPVERVIEYPVEEGSPTEKAALLDYAFVANGASPEEAIGLKLLARILAHEASPLVRSMQAAFPGVILAADADLTLPDPYLALHVYGIDAGDAARVRDTLDQALAGIAETGLNQDIVRAALSAERINRVMSARMANLGVGLSAQLAGYWASWDTLDYNGLYERALDQIEACADDYFAALLGKYVIENNHKALLTTVPIPGGAAARDTAQAERLQAIKAAMTEAEITALVEETAAMAAWTQEEAPAALLESLQVVTVDTLPEEMKLYDVMERETDGITLLSVETSIEDVVTSDILLDASGIPQELLHYYLIYANMIGRTSTPSHDKEALETMITRYLASFGAYPTTVRSADGSYRPVLSIGWTGLDHEYDSSIPLLNEIVFDTDLDDIDKLREIIGQLQGDQRYMMGQYGSYLQGIRATSIEDGEYAYLEHVNGLPYHRFIMQADQALNADPDGFIGKLKEVQRILRNRQDAVVQFLGSAAGIEAFSARIENLFAGIPAQQTDPAEWRFDTPARREGIITDATVQYNLLYDSLENLGLAYSGKLFVLGQVIANEYLTPEIRQANGAYGIFLQAEESGLTLCSYRDPVIAETFATYAGIAKYCREADLSQEDIDRYILSAYAMVAAPEGDLYGALSAMRTHLQGRPQDEKLTRLREMKSVTIEDLRALAPAFERLVENGVRSSVGSAAMIEQHADLFDVILRLSETE